MCNYKHRHKHTKQKRRTASVRHSGITCATIVRNKGCIIDHIASLPELILFDRRAVAWFLDAAATATTCYQLNNPWCQDHIGSSFKRHYCLSLIFVSIKLIQTQTSQKHSCKQASKQVLSKH